MVLHIKNLNKTINDLKILKDINLELKKGETIALVGTSGAGKTTLLQIAALLDHPNSGDVIINKEKTSHLKDIKRTHIRLHKIGFVYQFHHLLPDFTALENTAMPLLIKGISKKHAFNNAEELLEQVGLDKRLTHRPDELSGGERQRVAIARALANTPQILLADEPTGNLDSQTSTDVFSLLMREVKKRNMSTLIATHNKDLAQMMDRIVTIKDGEIIH